MARYDVQFAQVRWLTVHSIEAENEDDALDLAYEELPGMTAQETGYCSFNKWSADADEWYPLDDFYNTWASSDKYSEAQHGAVVYLSE